MRKYLSFLLVTMMTLFLVSCQSGNGSSKEINYKAGVKEIDLTFLGDNVAYEERPLNLFMRINNNLAYNAEDVRVSVVGFDEAYVELSNRQQVLGSMEGQSVFNPDGEVKEIQFSGNVKRLPPGAGEIKQDYLIYIEYLSMMDFGTTVCVGPILYGIEDGGCKESKSDGRSQKLSYSGQGAPLAVTEMEVISGNGRVELRLKLRNQGKGDVGLVSISQSSLGGKELNCQFRNSVSSDLFTFTKEKKEAELICETLAGSSSTYETPVQIEFIYDYKLKLKQQLQIRN